MKQAVIHGIRYTYEYKEIHIGDKVLSPTLDSVYEATIMDADDLGFVVISEEQMKLSDIDIEEEFEKFLETKGYVSIDEIADGDITEFVQFIFKMVNGA